MFSKYRMAANATMATSSADRYAASFTSASVQPYNNFTVRTNGGNIIQGQINKVRMAEINFPYNIPTVCFQSNDRMAVVVLDIALNAAGTGYEANATIEQILLPPKFYNATEAQVAITAQIANFSQGAANFVCGVDPVTLSLYFANTSSFSQVIGTAFFLYLPVPDTIGFTQFNSKIFTTQTLAWTLGLKNLFANSNGPNPYSFVPIGGGAPTNSQFYFAIVPINYPQGNNFAATGLPYFGDPQLPNSVSPRTVFTAIVGSPFTGLYTEYIDITSPQLCQNQYVRDGNTNQGSNHRDLICRLYIADETSMDLTANYGRPFLIHRQFRNPKIMKWTAERSIDAIDIQLWDQYGNPIPNIPINFVTALNGAAGLNITYLATGYGGPNNFALTFTVDESESGSNSY